jgi:probable selenium-dependent hydroxylase accessory protein YqeC
VPARAIRHADGPRDKPESAMAMTSDVDLLDLLAARSGIVCTVGAGGKKTTLYALLAAHPGHVALTATVRMARFPEALPAEQIIDAAADLPDQVLAAAAKHRRVAFAQPVSKKDRLDGVPPDLVADLHRRGGFEVTLVKADGARMHWIKAPAADEPLLPPGTTTVIPLVSARAIGAPLGERVAHRIEQLSAVTGVAPGDPLTAAHVARLLSDPRGALQGVGDATVVPVINMVDDDALERAARAVAERALAATDRFDRVVLTSMNAAEPVRAVVTR